MSRDGMVADLSQVMSMLAEDKSNDWSDEIAALERVEKFLSAPERDGTVHAAVIEALRERRLLLDVDADSHLALQAAEDWVNDWPDAFWDEFAGPMLDEIERRFS